MKSWTIGISGASGSIYGTRLIAYLLERGYNIHLVISDAGWRVLQHELGWNAAHRTAALQQAFPQMESRLHYYPLQDVGASIASGSFRTEGMAIVPCSMGTLAGIAHGTSDNLMKRAADVMLKEQRKLVLVPRETPLHAIHLENMLKLARLGAAIVPAMPAFYHKPEDIHHAVDFVVGKVLDIMDIEHHLFQRWGNGDD